MIQNVGESVNVEKDNREAATGPKYGEIYQQIQSKFGGKSEKPREIKKTLGKDDFLKIMITQLKNQDPTSPFKAEQMATEVAQFTSVEQLQNVNQNLSKMAIQNRPLEQMAMTNLIGKFVTVDHDRFPHVEGENEELSFQLPKDAVSLHFAIYNEAGEVVFEKDLGKHQAGQVMTSWDGRKQNTLPAKTGNYIFRIEAKDERNQPIEVNPRAQAQVMGVSFEGTEPIFLVGDAHHQNKVTLKNIVKIEVEKTAEGTKKGPSPSSPGGKAGNFFTFQKGVGSAPADTDLLTHLGKTEKAPEKAPPEKAPMEKGFPNGLREQED